MAPPEVEVDADLAERADKVAAKRGETLEEVVERMLRAYVEVPPRDDS